MRVWLCNRSVAVMGALVLASPSSYAADSVPVAAAPAISFDAALQLITGDATAVKQAKESVASAQARVDQSRYLYFPSLSAQAAAARNQVDTPFYMPLASQTAGITAEMNIYRFGADAAKKDAALATAASASHALAASLLDTELKGAEALFDLISLAQEQQIAQGFVAVRRDSVATSKRLSERGARAIQETQKTEIDAANEEARLADVEARLAAARGQIVRLVGRPIVVASTWPWKTQLTAAGQMPALVGDGRTPDFSQMPERQALAESTRSLEIGLDEIRARQRPSLDATVGYTVARQVEPDLQVKQLTGTLSLTVPLFDRFAARADYEEQSHRQQIAALGLAEKDRDLRAAWDEARTALITSLKSAQARDKTLAAARALYGRSLNGFRAGILSANDLTLDQSRLYETELNAVRGWADVHRYLARLCRGVGRRLADCTKGD